MWGRVTKNLDSGTDNENKIMCLKHSKLLLGGWQEGKKDADREFGHVWREEIPAPWTSFCVLLWWSDKDRHAAWSVKARFCLIQRDII